MPAIAAFLKGTVSESLTKLVQPAGLVPATFFILLNLAFIYPTAVADKIGIAKTFSDLSDGWQAVAAAAVSLALGYVLLNSATAISETLAGENWRRSALGAVLLWWQGRRRRRLEQRAANAADDENTTEISWRVATRFPPSSTGSLYLAPTHFGNVLAATQYTLHDRYGIELTALWGPLESTPAVKDAPALASVKDERSTLDLLANTIFILALFTFECLAFFGLRGRWDEALLSLLALPVAYVVYRLAVRAARTWGDSVLVSFDLHRHDLRDALGLRKSGDAADQFELWDAASGFYLAGGGVAASAVFDEISPSLSIVAPPGLATTPAAVDIADICRKDEWQEHDLEGQETTKNRVVLCAIEYSLLVARVGEAEQFVDTDIVVSDARVTAIGDRDVPIQVRQGVATATAHRLSGDGSSLVWTLSRLDQGAALSLDYQLPIWTLTTDSPDKLPAVSLQPGLGFCLEWQSATTVTLTVTSLTRTDPLSPLPTLSGTDAKLDPDRDEAGVYHATGVTVNAKESLYLELK